MYVRYGERATICHASLCTGIRRDRAGNTFADVSKKFSSIIVSVVALIFGLFSILVLRVSRRRLSQRKCRMMGQVTTENIETFYRVVSLGTLSHIYYSSGSIFSISVFVYLSRDSVQQVGSGKN